MNKQEKLQANIASEPEFSAFLHRKGRDRELPVSGSFELSPRCNFNCKMCYIHSEENHKSSEKELSTREWLDIARSACDAGVLFVLLTGGEPFIREDFEEIYSGLKKLGFIISINSNGSLIKGKNLELLKKNPPFRLNISLYGASDETYGELCGLPAFSQVLENIRALRDIGVQTKINCSITKYNFQDAEKIFELSKELGLFIKGTSYMYPKSRQRDAVRGDNSGRLTPLKAAECRLLWDEAYYGREEFLKRARGLKNGIAAFERECIDKEIEGKALRCRAGSSSFWISWQGFMSACGIIPDEQQNVLKNGFDECWKAVREKTSAIRLPKECSVCPYRHFCNVCAAVCFSETGGYDKRPEYVCEMNRETARLIDLYLKGEAKP